MTRRYLCHTGVIRRYPRTDEYWRGLRWMVGWVRSLDEFDRAAIAVMLLAFVIGLLGGYLLGIHSGEALARTAARLGR